MQAKIAAVALLLTAGLTALWLARPPSAGPQSSAAASAPGEAALPIESDAPPPLVELAEARAAIRERELASTSRPALTSLTWVQVDAVLEEEYGKLDLAALEAKEQKIYPDFRRDVFAATKRRWAAELHATLPFVPKLISE